MTYTYLLNNGETHSDYRIEAIVQSDTELDWQEIKDRVRAEFAPRQTDEGDYWYGPERSVQLLEILSREPGVRILAYQEEPFDLRYSFDGPINDPASWEWA